MIFIVLRVFEQQHQQLPSDTKPPRIAILLFCTPFSPCRFKKTYLRLFSISKAVPPELLRRVFPFLLYRFTTGNASSLLSSFPCSPTHVHISYCRPAFSAHERGNWRYHTPFFFQPPDFPIIDSLKTPSKPFFPPRRGFFSTSGALPSNEFLLSFLITPEPLFEPRHGVFFALAPPSPMITNSSFSFDFGRSASLFPYSSNNFFLFAHCLLVKYF